MSRKKSLFEASEAAAAASKDFPFTPWLVIDGPRKVAKMVIEADLLSVPDGGYIEVYDEIIGKQVYYRERN